MTETASTTTDNTRTVLTMTEADFSAATYGMGHPGVCLSCGESRLWGLENAMLVGAVDITE